MSLEAPLTTNSLRTQDDNEDRGRHTAAHHAYVDMMRWVVKNWDVSAGKDVHISLEGEVVLGTGLVVSLSIWITAGIVLVPVYLLCWTALAARHIDWQTPRCVCGYIAHLLKCLSGACAFFMSVLFFFSRRTPVVPFPFEVIANFGMAVMFACIFALDLLFLLIAESVGESGIKAFMLWSAGASGGFGTKMLDPGIALQYMKISNASPLVATSSFQDQFCSCLETEVRAEEERRSNQARDGAKARDIEHEKCFRIDAKILHCNGDVAGVLPCWVYMIALIQGLTPIVMRVAQGRSCVDESILMASLQVLYIPLGFSAICFFFSNFIDALHVLKLHRSKLELVIYYSTIRERKELVRNSFVIPNAVASDQLDGLLMKPRLLESSVKEADSIFQDMFGGEVKTVGVRNFLIIRKLHMLENCIVRVLAQIMFAALCVGAVVNIIFLVAIVNPDHDIYGVSVALTVFDFWVCLLCSFYLFSNVVGLNSIISDRTMNIFLTWKEQLFFMMWALQEGFRKKGFGAMTPERLQLDNYFRSMIEPHDHMISYIQNVQIPMNFFKIPVTDSLQKKLIAVASPFAFSATVNFLKKQQFVQDWFDKV